MKISIASAGFGLAIMVCFAQEPDKAPAPPKVAANVQKLIDQLGDQKFETRQSASKELVKLGREAVAGLRLALKHADPEVRMRARGALESITSSPTYLKSALTDPDKSVRRQAAEIIEQLGGKVKELAPLLVEAIKDKDEEVREAMIMALIAVDPDNKALADTTPLKASVKGKYGKLLKRIHVPADKASYTEFSDFGQYGATDYAGHQGIPAGYWVYVYPHWYIWGEQKK
jgi:hypothetical protein